jgi:hypothetical protein
MKTARSKQWAILVFFLASVLLAHPTIDQEEVIVDMTVGGLAIGGPSDEKLAQTFTAAHTGCLTHITVPIGCDPTETLLVQIQQTTGGVPNGTVLLSETFAGSLFPGLSPSSVQGGFRIIEFKKPLFISAGTEYAIVLHAGFAGCGWFQGPLGDPYLRGHAYFDARPNPPGWVRNGVFGRDDQPFQTYVEVTDRAKDCRKCPK